MARPFARKGRAMQMPPVACLPVVACAFWLAGCPTTSTLTAYTPITGIVIHSADLVAGHGCGMGQDQVYKYVAVLAYSDSNRQADGSTKPTTSIVPYSSTVVSCYADGIFSNLQPSTTSNPYDFTVYVYAYNAASFPPALACTPDSAGGCPGDNPCSTATPCDAGVEPRYPPSWTATCSAIEQAGVPALATCGRLEPVTAPTTITIGTQAFPTTDGGVVSCRTDYDFAAATSLSFGDAGVPPEASAVECPAPIVLPVAATAAPYAIEVSLTRGDAGAEIARPTCTATTTPGNTTYAVCSPAKPAAPVIAADQ
jgi:hypothetical protein